MKISLLTYLPMRGKQCKFWMLVHPQVVQEHSYRV